MSKTVFVLGGDGFLGFPVSLRLSNLGYDVVIIDNLSRRSIDLELNTASLTPISTIQNRIKKWHELTGKTIEFHNINIASEYDQLLAVMEKYQPMGIIHFAEQRSAPYSMLSTKHKRYTVNNNVNATNNVLCAVTEAGIDPHVIHLGTMGVYGYGDLDVSIPEGYLDIKYKNRNNDLVDASILFPPNPGSVYHTTKVLDHSLLAFYAKNDQIRITDLHQGVVWGTLTQETNLDEVLINRFDYDGEYGTVLNRFIVEGVTGHPITIYGTGEQARGFIHINDTLECIRLTLENPPSNRGKVRVFNQVTETFKVHNLAKLVSELTGTEIRYFDNPRNEKASNELFVDNANLLKLGLQPTTLKNELINEVSQVVKKYEHNINRESIISKSLWHKSKHTDFKGRTQI